MPSFINNKLLYWKNKYFTGVCSIFTNSIPIYQKVERILFIVSSNWEIANKAKEWIENHFPNAKISYVLRDDYPPNYIGEDIFVSSRIVKIPSKIKTIFDLRKKQFDIVVTCWTNESGFTSLKQLPFLVSARSILVFNENADCFWLIRKNISIILRHIFNRFPYEVRFRKIFNLLTIVFLTPLGMIYVIFRVGYYMLKRFCIKFLTHSNKY